MYCCALFCVHSSFAIISMGKRDLIVLLCLSSWCLVIVVWLFLTMPRLYLQFVIVVIPIILTYYLDGEEKAECYALFVFLVSHDCCRALPRDATGCLQFVIVVCPNNTHLLF